MKKYAILALALVVGASFNTADAAKKKKKEQKVAEVVEEVKAPVTLSSSRDSVSYAAGISLTNGLLPYLQQQGVKTEYLADFVKGFQEAVATKNDEQQKARRMGMQIADQVVSRMLPGILADFADTPDSIAENLLFRGFTDAVESDTTVMLQKQAETLFQQKSDANKQAKTERQMAAGKAFLAENAKKEGVIVTPSGLQYKVLKQGDGQVPQVSDKVKVHYEGRLIDGTVFDASSKHGTEPATFQPNQVIKGWTEALTMMPVGSKWQLYIPQELAYGARQAGQIPPYSTLIFDVELVEIEK
ncbi:MAG: FKBP-type peptidyl-prolyl cis-trans isomerase [Prevotella sp.]|nr:FKBP-type peptidyl-prolyl cis-trans isomerase [Prevotella sp.]